MKELYATLTLLATISVILFSGCATLQNQEPAERLANRLESVAFIGTATVVKNNPEYRVIFETVQQELLEQQERGSLTYETLVSILKQLPIDELEGDDALLYVEGGRALFNPDGGPIIDLGETGGGLLTVAGGIRRGIERGLAW